MNAPFGSGLTLRLLAPCLVFALASCDPPPPAQDAGSDAGEADAGADAGRADSGMDAGAVDAGGDDAGAGDAGDGDAGDGDAGADGGVDAGDVDAGPPPDCVGPPGLYSDADCTVLATDVLPYHPQYELWSDDADKERFVYLPPGAQIDTSDPDRWGFPMGTRVYKTFSLAGVRLETRIFEKVAAARGRASWTIRSWAWSADQRSVTEVGAIGAQDLLGTTHDIPGRGGCIECHSIAQDDVVVGFSAIQLAHDDGGVTLGSLMADGRLSHAIAPGDAVVPGDATTAAALGYMHANCGNCHGGPTPERGLDLWLPVGTGSVETSAAYTSSVCVCAGWAATTAGGDPIELRVDPGDPVRSVFTHRMGLRTQNEMMPPLATEQVDAVGLQIVSDWISALPTDAGGCPTTCL